MRSKKNIVVVGAGAAARVVVKSLRPSPGASLGLNITVIQPNKFASLPYFQTFVLTKKDTLTQNSTFTEIAGADKTVFGVAVACSDGVLAVQPLNNKGEKDDSMEPVEVPFDILVAATGSAFPTVCETPGQSIEERQAEIDKVSSAILSGKEVVIAGGGATGVELTGDLLECLPADSRKGKVTLICSSDRLIPDQPEYYSQKSKEVLEKLGATIIFNERVQSHQETTIATDGSSLTLELKSGKPLNCHVYVPCYSRGANSQWLKTPHGDKGGLPTDLLNERGQVIVDDHLQSTSYEKIYAIGAVNSRKATAIGMNVESEAKVVGANIKKPKSSRAGPGLEHTVYQPVGHNTFVTIMPENLPLPACCSTLCCHWCGFPFNLLCPCFCCAVVCGPIDPMTCGACCARPEGEGLAKTMQEFKKMGVLAENMGYMNLGVTEPQKMDR